MTNRLTWISATLTVVFWSSAFTGIRVGLMAFTPYHLVLLRFLVASAVFLVIAPFAKIGLLPRRAWPRVVASGVLGLTVYHTCLSVGELKVSPATAGFIVSLAPILTGLFSLWLRRERYLPMGWIGVAMSLAGVLTITGVGSPWRADTLWIVVATVATSLYFVIEKPLLEEFRPLEVTAWVTWAGTLPMILYGHGLWAQMMTAPALPIISIVYIGIFPAAVAYMLWNVALARLPAPRVTPILYAAPFLASLMSWVTLGSSPSIGVYLGGVVVIMGVIIVQRFGIAAADRKSTAA